MLWGIPTCMHINYEKRLFMEVNYTSIILMLSLLAAVDGLWLCNGEIEREKKMEQKWRRDAVDAVSHKFTATSN